MDTLQDKASAFVDGLSKEILYLQEKMLLYIISVIWKKYIVQRGAETLVTNKEPE